MLKARNTELSELSSKLFSDVRAQSQTIEALRSRSDELATERDIHRQHAQAREGRITMLQQRIAAVESSRMKERLFREEERGELEALREEAKAGKAALKTERARLTREQNKFVQDKRTARNMLAGVKDSVDALNAQFAADRSMDGSEDEDEKEPGTSSRFPFVVLYSNPGSRITSKTSKDGQCRSIPGGAARVPPSRPPRSEPRLRILIHSTLFVAPVIVPDPHLIDFRPLTFECPGRFNFLSTV